VPRSSAYYIAKEKTLRRMIDPALAARIKELIETQAAFGIRTVWAWLRFVDGLQINRKKVERIMHLKRWTLKTREPANALGSKPPAPSPRCLINAGPPPLPSSTAAPTAGAPWSRSSTAAPARSSAGNSIAPLAPKPPNAPLRKPSLTALAGCTALPQGLALRRDNGLVFGSRLYCSPVRRYGLKQEYIPPYTPEQNGLCERFIHTLKE